MGLKEEFISVLICFTMMFSGSFAQMCSICEDGAMPQNSDTLLKFFPGTLPQTEYTCKELHFLGVYNDRNVITPEICTFLVRLASFSCGCRGNGVDQDTKMPQKVETQVVDVTVNGASNDVILSSTFVSTQTANLTKVPLPSSTIIPTTTPLPAQSETSDIPSSNPTMDKDSTLTPSISPFSMRNSVTSMELDNENFSTVGNATDQNGNEAIYRSMLMEIFQKLNSFFSHLEIMEKPNPLPTNYGKLRGM